MDSSTLHKFVGAIQFPRGCRIDSFSLDTFSCFSSRRFFPIGFATGSKLQKIGLVLATSNPALVVNPDPWFSHDMADCDQTAPTESALILLRHGESMWNEKNLFTGCVDVALTQRGIEEAIEAGKRIGNIPVDIIYTSALVRSQMTAMLAMTQHRQKKVPIIVHDESARAIEWGQISSKETKKQSIPVITDWKLNERMYGELQGFDKKETSKKYGKEMVHEWRRGYELPPPGGESLKMCLHRAVAFFREKVEPQLRSGKNVMVAAHANSLRSIIMYLENLTPRQVMNLEISNGIPLLYIYNGERFMSRGSPVGPTEAGVYAHTKALALYRQELEEMSAVTY